MDFVAFAASTAAALWMLNPRPKPHSNIDIQLVDKDNKEASFDTDESIGGAWFRSSFILIMNDPPHLYHEPKWSHTSVLFVAKDGKLSLPNAPVKHGQSYQQCAITLLQQYKVDVSQPENCLHHLFTFPFACSNDKWRTEGIWADFFECIYRGSSSRVHTPQGTAALQSFTLEDLNQMVIDGKQHPNLFQPETLHALKLFFQRQNDLFVQRRIRKGYSSSDLERYGLTRMASSSEHGEKEKIVFLDTNSFQRQQAVEFTTRTDDGMSPKMLSQAEVVLLGVSRVGKSPLSLFLAQTSGLKVANVPLVQELEPPKQLFEDVDPSRVFCLTMNASQLLSLRRTRFRREIKKQLPGQRNCVYADANYVKQDLEYAQSLSRTHGFTELDITNRAMEENASLIVSKMKERFPDLHIL